MKKFISTNPLFIFCILVSAIAGVTYSLLAPKIYTSKSHIALFRLKIENPDISSEESRNRWVWIRDGLNLKSALITDTMLLDIIESNSTAKEQALNYPNKQLMMDYLKTLINIQFTGADENNFLIEVRAPSPALAFDLNTKIYDRIKYLAIEADQSNFNAVLDELKKKQLELKQDQAAYDFYQDKIRKMIFTNTIEQKQKETAFQIISKPSLNDHPIWPNPKLIILLALFIGSVIGFALEYFFKFYVKSYSLKINQNENNPRKK